MLREAERLVKAGVKELIVIAQDTSAYGRDLKYAASEWRGRETTARFLDITRELGTLGAWVRLQYVYPYPHVDEVIELMNGGNVLPYIDVPFQHASPAVLKAMRRPAAQEKTLERIRAWRAICPELTIRSTFIVGFPGETEDDFAFLLDWLDEAKLDRVGAFPYEPVGGAVANDLGLEPVPDEIKASRHKRFMAARPGDQREEARRQGRQAPRSHRRRGRRARGQRAQQGRRAADRRRSAYRDPPAAARRRHCDGEDRPLRRLRFVGRGLTATETSAAWPCRGSPAGFCPRANRRSDRRPSL